MRSKPNAPYIEGHAHFCSTDAGCEEEGGHVICRAPGIYLADAELMMLDILLN